MSELAQQLLETSASLEVHSVFESAVNLAAADRLITCTTAPISAPHGLELSAPDLASLQTSGRQRPAERLHWCGEKRELRSESGAVAISASSRLEVFDPSLPVLGVGSLGAGVELLRERLDRTGLSTGFGDEWRALSEDQAVARATQSLLSCAVDDSVRYWLGRGPGLTPSGDDLLLGMIAALWCAGSISGSGAAALRDELEPIARQRTTRVSVEYLHHACAGKVIDPLQELLVVLDRGDAIGIAGAVDRLRLFGHTSGADCLLGVLAAQHFLVRDLPSRRDQRPSPRDQHRSPRGQHRSPRRGGV
jgi:hypothetical protein